MTVDDELNDIAHAAFEAELPPIKHAIFDLEGLPFMCRICGKNEWIIERVLPDGIPVYTCSHGTIEGIIRQVDSVNGQRVEYVTALG